MSVSTISEAKSSTRKASGSDSRSARTSRTNRRRRIPGEAPRKLYSANTINGEAWRAWLLATMTVDEDNCDAVCINGRRVKESDTRALHRWLKEDVCPSFTRIDQWCVDYGLHVNVFMRWCDEPRSANGRKLDTKYCPWQLGVAPSYETDELTAADWAEIEAAWPLPEGETDSEPEPEYALAA